MVGNSRQVASEFNAAQRRAEQGKATQQSFPIPKNTGNSSSNSSDCARSTWTSAMAIANANLQVFVQLEY